MFKIGYLGPTRAHARTRTRTQTDGDITRTQVHTCTRTHMETHARGARAPQVASVRVELRSAHVGTEHWSAPLALPTGIALRVRHRRLGSVVLSCAADGKGGAALDGEVGLYVGETYTLEAPGSAQVKETSVDFVVAPPAPAAEQVRVRVRIRVRFGVRVRLRTLTRTRTRTLTRPVRRRACSWCSWWSGARRPT